MAESRKLAAILAADVVGFSRLTGADEDRTLARLRALRSDLLDHGRVVKRTGDGLIVEFRSAVDAVRCAIEVQSAMFERNAGVAPDRRIKFRIGVHLGDVVEESDGDLMGDGVNIAARLEGICEPAGVCLSGAAYEQIRDRVKESFVDLGEKTLKNIARPARVYAVRSNSNRGAEAIQGVAPGSGPPRLSIVVLPFANIGGDPEQDYFVDGVTESLTTDLSRIDSAFVIARNTAFTYKNKALDVTKIGRELNVRYVLEGSAQRGGNRMRVNVQLIDAQSGNHLWAERFEKPVTDLFRHAGRDRRPHCQFAQRAAHCSRGAAEHRADIVRIERGPTVCRRPNSMDLYFQGMAWINRGVTPKSMAKARGFFERALAPRGSQRQRPPRLRRFPWPQTMPSPTFPWASSSASPTVRFRASLNSSGRWL